MSTKYIQLYSGNRNRQDFPNPASFSVPFAATPPLKNSSYAKDPVIKGTIYYKFQYIPQVRYGYFQPGSSAGSPILDPKQHLGLSQEDNYYAGWIIIDVETREARRIKTFNASSGMISMNQLFTSNFSGSGQYALATNFDPNFISIPQTDINGNKALNYEQAYINYYVVFETHNSYSNEYNSNIFYRKIIYYDHIERIAYFDQPLPADYNPTIGPQLFTLRQSLPFERWRLTTATYENIITLPEGASSIDNYYTGNYVYFSSNNIQKVSRTTIFYPIYGFYYITSYNGQTKELTVMSDINKTPFPTLYDTIDLTTFLQDNYCPYSYNGSIVSESQAVCYEVSLDNLTVPNLVLASGSRIAFYSFLYVELRNISSPTSSLEPIQSNNYVSKSALFVVPITQSVQPEFGTYMGLSSGMRQNIKIKPNDGFIFSIFLPDGTLFQTLEKDILAPYPPNLFLQINATFSLRRI